MTAMNKNTFTQQNQENKLNQFQRKAQRNVVFFNLIKYKILKCITTLPQQKAKH